jgi:DNA gyrase subunit A
MVNDDNDVMMITSNGTIIRVHAKDISIFGRTARGVTLMKASGDNYITGCDVTSYDEGEESVSPVEVEDAADVTDAAETDIADEDVETAETADEAGPEDNE